MGMPSTCFVLRIGNLVKALICVNQWLPSCYCGHPRSYHYPRSTPQPGGRCGIVQREARHTVNAMRKLLWRIVR